jgi:hypothetical protein
MHAGRYHETPASSDYKSQRRNLTEERGEDRGKGERTKGGKRRDREGKREEENRGEGGRNREAEIENWEAE